MATPSEKLAQSLDILKNLQSGQGIAVIKSNELSRTHRERLIENGFLKVVIKGWYISSRPDEKPGDTTSWYISFWYFTSIYIKSKFEDNWCLSPEQSLFLISGNQTVPNQLLIRSPKASNNNIKLLHQTSLFDLKLDIPDNIHRIEKNGIQMYNLPEGLISVSKDFFSHYPTDARTCLSMIKDASDLLVRLLEGGRTVIAGRLAGALRNVGKTKIADEIMKTMKSAGYDIRETDPFNDKLTITLDNRQVSPYANRIKLMWHQYRQEVLDNFPTGNQLPSNTNKYIQSVEDSYAEDAYHSLSIEGYSVTSGLIEKVREGDWNPDENQADSKERNAMAARGYFLAFQEVKRSIQSILKGSNAGQTVDDDHSTWYRELFAPSVTAGIIKASDLAGYRNSQVFIKGSMHTPPSSEAVRDAMPVLFDLLKEEKEPCVRAVLGHFIFVYIHPYIDGNGRIGRFLFNTMLASGGYPWTVIPVDRRDEYMTALEQASVEQNIIEFSKFLGQLVKK